MYQFIIVLVLLSTSILFINIKKFFVQNKVENIVEVKNNVKKTASLLENKNLEQLSIGNLIIDEDKINMFSKNDLKKFQDAVDKLVLKNKIVNCNNIVKITNLDINTCKKIMNTHVSKLKIININLDNLNIIQNKDLNNFKYMSYKIKKYNNNNPSTLANKNIIGNIHDYTLLKKIEEKYGKNNILLVK